MRKYFEYINKQQNGWNEEGSDYVSNFLASSLKKEVLVDIYGRILNNQKLFYLNFSQNVIRNLALVVKEKTLGPEEILYE